MKSMTGFGQGDASCPEHNTLFNVEISSVNRKQLDMRITLPAEFSAVESSIRKIISSKVSRGSVMAKIDLNSDDAINFDKHLINESLLTSLVGECRTLGKKLSITSEIKLSELLAVPGVINENSSLNKCPQCVAAICEATEKAVANLVKMRTRESEELQLHLSANLKNLENIVRELTPATAKLPLVNRDKIIKRIEDAGLSIDTDDDRILREVVIFADRYDVSEELARLQSHFTQFRNFLNNNSEPVGRSLEFVIQEIQREITTLGNKAAACDTSPLVVQFKGELEKIREQVMNIE